MKTVGILGGMGPEATILLMQKCLDAIDAKDDADHIPLIVHQNPQVPSRIAALIEGTGDDPAPVLKAMANDLKQAGAQALAMPCNTAHHYASAAAGEGLPFLHMINLTAEKLKALGAHRIGMLASPATRMASVFDTAFANNGLEPIWHNNEDAVLDLIKAVKSGVTLGELLITTSSLAQGLVEQGCDHILVACTELSLLTDALPDNVAWVDSLDCLTSAIVEFAHSD